MLSSEGPDSGRSPTPRDETCFYLYEAASADAVRVAAERAGLPFEHVVEAVTDTEAHQPRKEHESAMSKGGKR